ncbi:divergent PAP2 family protein [Risungbinella massiliensis]|uniref:divergent PAP2 family protein n=1 Tax=Risungbinella massiliensis TaxID=1329796 RepID=UPI0005CC28C3|nr:divergent PAP2 family protein [Risungbinella massiliensis]
MFSPLLSNFALWTSILAIILAQLLKIPWNYTLTQKWEWKWFYFSGGMPSSHTAAVTSLATSVGILNGWNSVDFAIATILSVIVMYDATGVRRQAGMQAQVLNRLVEDFQQFVVEIREMNKKSPEETRIKLKEILGHKPIEVFVGAWFGVLFSLLMYWFWY